MAGTIAELKQLMGKLGMQPASTASNVTTPNVGNWGQVPLGQLYPITNVPAQPIYDNYAPKHVLSDFDIELMAACISNKHPVVDGQSHCFCTLKRLERGISKD